MRGGRVRMRGIRK
jgi:hypothetical protein